jgi:replicative DNA helicase
MVNGNPLKNMAAERDVLSALLRDRGAIVVASEILRPGDFQDINHQEIARVIWQIYEDGELVNRATVLGRLSNKVDHDYVAALANATTHKMLQELEWNCRSVSMAAIKARLDDAASRIRDDLLNAEIADPAAFVEDCLARIAAVQDDVLERDSSLSTIDEELRSREKVPVWPTGLDWLDAKTGGFGAGQVWVLAAPYKMRKSTLVRNLIINVCRQGVAFDWFNLERSRDYHYAGLVAMVANQLICRQGRLLPVTERQVAYHQGDNEQQRVIDQAREEVLSWSLRIYDGRDGIANLDKIIALVRRCKILHRTQMFAVDHLQRLEGKDKLFERMSSAANRLANLIVTTSTCGILVSQMDNASIRTYGDTDDASTFVGTKGSGDIPAAADVVLMTEYDPDHAPEELRVRLKISRDSSPGLGVHRIEPQSGVILGRTR